jgi:hypothetical protein
MAAGKIECRTLEPPFLKTPASFLEYPFASRYPVAGDLFSKTRVSKHEEVKL